MVRHTLQTLGPKVLATRMVRDYVLALYAPAVPVRRGRSTAASRGPRARRLEGAGPRGLAVGAGRPRRGRRRRRRPGGRQHPRGARLRVARRAGARGRRGAGRARPGRRARPDRRLVHGVDCATRRPTRAAGTGTSATVALDRPGPFGYTARVVPHHRLLATAGRAGPGRAARREQRAWTPESSGSAPDVRCDRRAARLSVRSSAATACGGASSGAAAGPAACVVRSPPGSRAASVATVSSSTSYASAQGVPGQPRPRRRRRPVLSSTSSDEARPRRRRPGRAADRYMPSTRRSWSNHARVSSPRRRRRTRRCPSRRRHGRGPALEELVVAQHRVLAAQREQGAGPGQQVLLPRRVVPGQPGRLVVDAVGVVVAALGAARLVARPSASARRSRAAASPAGCASAAGAARGPRRRRSRPRRRSSSCGCGRSRRGCPRRWPRCACGRRTPGRAG